MADTLRFPDALAHAQQQARAQIVHKRQCLLLCAFIERTLTTPDADPAPETAQQYDDTLSNISGRFAEWSKFDVIQSYLRSDAIQAGIDQLAEELKWCGLRTEDLQWAEKRRQDAESLHDLLRKIVSDPALLEQVFKQSPESISLFIRRCQYALKDGTVSDSARPAIEAALMQLYKNQAAYIPTPNLSTQVIGIDPSPVTVRALYRTFTGSWLGRENVTIRSLRLVQIDLEGVKRFREDISRFYLVRHRNIAQVYGYIFSQDIGCCLISPSLSDSDSLTYLDQHEDTSVVPWLHDISSALFYLHNLPQPLLCGCLQAETIFIRNDGSAYISDFGSFQLSRKPWEAVERLLRWCAPEMIKAARKKEIGEDAPAICTKQSDVYTFAMAIFELFTGEVPVHHIENGSSLEPEIVHGNRPYMNADLKNKAKLRGFDDEIQQLMHNCWQKEAKKRPSVRDIVDILSEHTESTPARLRVRRSEVSTMSALTNWSSRSSSSTGSSAIHPLTPPSGSSGLPTGSFASIGSGSSGSPVSIVSPETALADSPPGSRIGHGQATYFEQRRIFAEPTQERDVGKYRQKDMDMLSKLSFQSIRIRDQVNPSEQTIRGAASELRSAFSSSSEESHLGQREDSAYERMPRLRPTSLQLPKRRGSGDPFAIVVTRMREDGQINPQWVGVANMERIRGMSKRSNKLTQVAAVENMITREKKFLEDKTDEYFTRRLEDAPGVLGDRLEKFLSSVFDDGTALRLVNDQFVNALQASSDVSVIGFVPFADLCKEAAVRFKVVYPEYVSRLPDIEGYIKEEALSNKRFAAFMNEKKDGRSHYELLHDFIHAPETHLDQHHLTLELILKEMDRGDPEIPRVQEARQEMQKTVKLIYLASWQQTTNRKEWKDFASADAVKVASKPDVNRQILIFELIADERDFVWKMKVIQTMLDKIALELENRRRKEDAVLIRVLVASFNDFLRFHERLLENLFILQRSLHPWIESFVSRCGVNLIPWHALYDHHFASVYLKVVNMLQDGNNIRMGVIKHVMQNVMPTEKVDFMEVLRTPSVHLRFFVDHLNKISASLPVENDDRQIITDMLPRLQDVNKQVELKTSSKDDARLSSLNSALDFSGFPGIEKHDVDITSKSRNLIFSGNLRVGVANSNSRSMTLQTRWAFLLDNYLLLTKKDDRPEFPSFMVSEKPVPLDIVSLSRNSIFPRISSEEVHPCVLLNIANQDSMYLFADSENASREWCDKLEVALKERDKAKAQIVTRDVLERFSYLPNCSADIVYSGETITITARDYPEPGIWLRQGSEIRLAHQMTDIAKLSVLEDAGLLLALTGQSLVWFRLDDMLGTGRISQKNIDNDMTVSWFRTGMLAKHMFLVVSAKKKKNPRNILRFYEVGAIRSSRSLPSLRSKSPFTLMTEIELTSTVRDIYFLRNSLILVTDTFQVVTYHNPQQLKESITNGKLQSLPLRDDPMTELAERCRYSTPIGIYRIDREFVLCYKETAVYINENGKLSNKVIEWESKDVQTVLFRPPHMLTFGSSMVEVRQLATGILEQLVPLPGQLRVAWEAQQKDDDSCNLGIHLLVSEGQNRQTRNSWYSLDEQHPFTLLRLMRR